jgi:hypothetical protein
VHAQVGGGFGADFRFVESAHANGFIGGPIHAYALGQFVNGALIATLKRLGKRLTLLVIDVVDSKRAIGILRDALREAGIVMESL